MRNQKGRKIMQWERGFVQLSTLPYQPSYTHRGSGRLRWLSLHRIWKMLLFTSRTPCGEDIALGTGKQHQRVVFLIYRTWAGPRRRLGSADGACLWRWEGTSALWNKEERVLLCCIFHLSWPGFIIVRILSPASLRQGFYPVTAR